MAIKIDIVSSELIRPSSPTPLHLKTYKLSLLDQLAPPIFTTVVLFYKANPAMINSSTTLQESGICSAGLKRSLSDTLTRYYPLAGRLVDGNDLVDCNDEGALFVEARVDTQLENILKYPQMNILQQFAPPLGVTNEDVPILTIHFNIFNCGSVGIGISIAHKVVDGSSLATFLTSWSAAATTSGKGNDCETMAPRMDSALFFPPKEIDFGMAIPACNLEVKKIEKNVTKRFVFSARQLALLRQTISVTNVTRVEAVTSILWKCLMAAARGQSGRANTSSIVTHAVNIRAKMDPPLPEHAFGNLLHVAMSPLVRDEAELELHDLVSGLRQEIQKINGGFLSKLQKGEELASKLESIKEMIELDCEGEFNFYWFSSWCRFPFFETDLGFGEPIWLCPTNWPLKNVVCLVDMKSEKGIEAWVTLTERDMKNFECCQELLKFTSSTPTVINSDPIREH